MAINWKNIFSLPKQKKVRAKVLDELNQPNSAIDASQVTGGLSSTPGQHESGWLKTETSGEPKV